jgi:hypothetical protein
MGYVYVCRWLGFLRGVGGGGGEEAPTEVGWIETSVIILRLFQPVPPGTKEVREKT